MLGGGMRQAGVLAAAGIVALEQMIDRLADDHANARRFAEGLADTPGFVVDLDRVQTNIVFFELDQSVKVTADVVAQRMLEQNVKLISPGVHFRRFRAVTHAWVDQADIDRALLAFKAAVA
jgi:threonine aldolase